MRDYFKIWLLAILCIVGCMIGKNTSYATEVSGADTTAPVVTNATFKTSSVNKGESIQLDLAVVENGTGIAKIQVGLYCYKGSGNSPLLIYGDMDYTGEDAISQYTGTITMDIPVLKSDGAGDYYVGNIVIIDNAGNKNTYFDHFNKEGYYVEGGKAYLQNYEKKDVSNACLITNGAHVTVISNGDDTAPIVTDVSFVSTKVIKPESIIAKLTVVEESKVSDVELSYEGYKNGQAILIGRWPLEWSQKDDIITAPMTLIDDDTAGVYYLTQITIKDSEGNSRSYACDFHNKKGYLVDDIGSYLVDTGNANIKCYIKDGVTVTVTSDGDDIAPIIKAITLQKEMVAKPGTLPIDLVFAEADEIKKITVIVRRNGATEQEIYDFTKEFSEKEKKSDYTVKFPIATAMNSDRYYIERIEVLDYSGNSRLYTAYGTEYPYLVEGDVTYMVDHYDSATKAAFTTHCMFDVKDEFAVDFEVALSNAELLSKVQALGEGKTGRVFIDGKGIAKAELFEAIKGQDKTLVFYNDNYQWVFNGLTVTTAKDVILKVSFDMVNGEDYQTSGQLLKIDFAANGELPGQANVRVKSDYTFELFEMSEAMYLYYLNPNSDQLDYEQQSNIEYILDGTDHWCQFDITHNSTYMVSGEKIVKIKSMKIIGMSKKLAAGKKMKLSVTTKPSDASLKKFKWTTNNKKYATVNSKGVVTAKKAGAGKKVKITATAKDGSKKKATYTLTIMKDSVKSVKLKAAKSVKAGRSLNVKATIKTTGKNVNKTLKWTSSNTKYATVNGKGKVTAKKAGKGKKVKITAQATDGSNKKATVTIQIK